MSNQFANLLINRVIVHQVFERTETREIQIPRYNNSLANLDTNALIILQNRIIDVLGHNSHSVEMEIVRTPDGDTFSIAAKMLDTDDQEFILKSQNIAYRLAEAQTARNIPGGVVVVFDGTVGSNSDRYIGFIKAEIHEGFSLRQNSEQLLLELLSDLCLTPQQKLYKIGMFIEKESATEPNAPRTAEQFNAYVYDQNMNVTTTAGAAIYFYESFLGCKFSPSDKRWTMDFHSHTKDYIDNLNVPDEKKVELQSALHSYLKVSQSNVVDVSAFGDEYLTPEQKDDYCSYMEANEFPSHAVAKDISLIQNKLKKRQITFSSNVSLSAPSDNFDELVEIIGHEGTKTTLRIEGFIKGQ